MYWWRVIERVGLDQRRLGFGRGGLGWLVRGCCLELELGWIEMVMMLMLPVDLAVSAPR